MLDFKERIRAALIASLKTNAQALAAWEGGSAANGTLDTYSDIDLVVIGRDSVDSIFETIETTLGQVSRVSHRYIEPKCFWPGCYQRVYFLEGAPLHFFVDAAVFLEKSQDVLHEFMQPERHGNPVVHFDRAGLVKPRAADPIALKAQHLKRLQEIEAALPVFKTEVFKELDRGHPIDAFGFYYGAILRPLVELMGMIYRPFRFDFGLRYLHKTFPEHEQKTIQRFLYVKDSSELRERVTEADLLFRDVIVRVHKKLEQGAVI